MSIKDNGLAEYEVDINGLPHTVQLDAETAKRTPGAKRVRRATVLDAGEIPRESAHLRTGTSGEPVVDRPTDEELQAAADRVNEPAPEQIEAATSDDKNVVDGSPLDAAAKREQTATARRGRAAQAKGRALAGAKARGAANKARGAEDK